MSAPTRPRARPDRVVRYRRRRIAAGLVAVVLLAVGVGLGVRVVLYDVGLADVQGITVIGTGTVSVAEVEQAAAVPRGVPLASVDTAAVAARVAALPGLASVRVARDWPHTVAVSVVEREPIAVVDTAAGPTLVDTAGQRYRPAPGTVELPRLVVADLDPGPPATTTAVTVLLALPDPVRAEVQTVEVTPAGQVALGLSAGRQVRWGGPERSAEKARVLVPLLTRPGTLYDVASPELPTVRP